MLVFGHQKHRETGSTVTASMISIGIPHFDTTTNRERQDFREVGGPVSKESAHIARIQEMGQFNVYSEPCVIHNLVGKCVDDLVVTNICLENASRIVPGRGCSSVGQDETGKGAKPQRSRVKEYTRKRGYQAKPMEVGFTNLSCSVRAPAPTNGSVDCGVDTCQVTDGSRRVNERLGITRLSQRYVQRWCRLVQDSERLSLMALPNWEFTALFTALLYLSSSFEDPELEAPDTSSWSETVPTATRNCNLSLNGASGVTDNSQKKSVTTYQRNAQVIAHMDLLPLEIIEAIVDQLEDSSLLSVCLVASSFLSSSQARIFRSLQIRVKGPFSSPIKDHRPISPWQAEGIFSVSPHLALYVQRLWMDIPPPTEPTMDWCPPLQTFLPTFTRMRHLIITGPRITRYKDLPEELRMAMQSVMSLPSLIDLQLAFLNIQGSLIDSLATHVPSLSLLDVVIEDDVALHSALPKQAYRCALVLDHISPTMLSFLATRGALHGLQKLSITYPRDWDHITKIVAQEVAPTLTHLCLRFPRRLSVSSFPLIDALRILELESAVLAGPYRLPDIFATLLSQIPSAMPHLEQLIIRLTVSTYLRINEPLYVEQGNASAHSGPLDLGQLGAVHCHLCFQDQPASDPWKARRELRATVYHNFVRCIGEQLPALRDSGGLSFSLIRLS
ncbi:hypothetical protein B0H19DRAFT_1061530 [Mycena capillaripes]|nr:hypothetical protein B0H19DRAFT_1061530 [Mycena capillaripes]